VAEALDLSRYTIFAYLKEIRHGDGAYGAVTARSGKPAEPQAGAGSVGGES